MLQNINIQLPANHVPQIKDFYLARLKDLETETTEIKTLLSQLDLQSYTPIVPNRQMAIIEPQSTLISYNRKWPLTKQAKYVLSTTGEPMTSKDIVDYIITNCDSSIKENRKRFMSSMSGTLSSKSREGGIFKREQNDADEFEYTLA